MRAIGLAIVGIVIGITSCGGGGDGGLGACGPDTCGTCCTTSGMCIPSVSSYSCGSGGGQCTDCKGAACETGGTCGPAPKRFFVTSTVHDGNFASYGTATTGLEGADALCAAAADPVQSGSTWRAWLSDSTTNAIDRITDVGPWFLFNGNEAFANKAALADFSNYQVDYDENGNNLSGEMWSGTNLDGSADSETCSDWSTTSGFGAAATKWGSTTPRNCFQEKPVFCIEQ